MTDALAAVGRTGSGYDYGNARVRARRAELFDAATYERLLGRDVDWLLAALADTPYRPDVEAALPRYRGLSALHRALSANLVRELRAVAGFYGGRPREGIELLLSDWDVHNVLTIVRALARRRPSEEILPLLVPAGALDEVAAGELARQPGLRPAIELMATWAVPTPGVARAALGALPAFEQTGELEALEGAVIRAHARAARRTVEREGWMSEALGHFLRERVDRRNVLVALRAREARLRGEPPWGPEDPYLPGGRGAEASLAALAGTDERQDVAVTLARLDPPAGWREPFERWAEHGELTRLERDLERAAVRRAVSMLWSGDPLGIDVPIAYVVAKENEVRNLRLLGYGADRGLSIDALRELVVAPW
ncbi:MAG TPA: V-type ATPase subunit [Actinomycetota bacterium]